LTRGRLKIKMRNKTYRLLGVVLLILGAALVGIPVANLATGTQQASAVSFLDRLRLTGGYEQELQAGEHITIVDEKTGAVVDQIARVAYPGDETITESNEIYEIVKVKGNKAFASKKGVATDIVWRDEWDITPAAAAQKAQAGNSKIAIYHTHSDESYVPTDGTETIPARGGILKVGSALAQQLKSKGITTLDDKTPHEPHDANAYHRSRRTAVRLMKERPLALLDVHRDGVPDPGFYYNEVEGEKVTRVRLVVGRQNPNMATNLEFAKRIKAYMDKHKPGLMRGIYIGRGSYNQDLSPRAMLLEIGTHTNNRFSAEKGADIFADALPAVLNIKSAPQPGGGAGNNLSTESAGEKSSAWSSIAWIIGVVLIGGAIFLFISTGSLKGMKSKLGELRKTEFANIFGLKKVSRETSREDCKLQNDEKERQE